LPAGAPLHSLAIGTVSVAAAYPSVCRRQQTIFGVIGHRPASERVVSDVSSRVIAQPIDPVGRLVVDRIVIVYSSRHTGDMLIPILIVTVVLRRHVGCQLPAAVHLIFEEQADSIQRVIEVIVKLRDDVAAACQRYPVNLPSKVSIVVRVVGEYVLTAGRCRAVVKGDRAAAPVPLVSRAVAEPVVYKL